MASDLLPVYKEMITAAANTEVVWPDGNELNCFNEFQSAEWIMDRSSK